MKTKKINRRLLLNKNTVANLESNDMRNLLGGAVGAVVVAEAKTVQLSVCKCLYTYTCETQNLMVCAPSSALPPTYDNQCGNEKTDIAVAIGD